MASDLYALGMTAMKLLGKHPEDNKMPTTDSLEVGTKYVHHCLVWCSSYLVIPEIHDALRSA